MGLGKTVQLLALEAHERKAALPPTLLLCPMSLVGTWQREAERFAPDLRVLALHGPGRPRGAALQEAIAQSDLVVTTYATATRDVDELAATAWRRLVLDEAQAVKNSRATAARAVRRISAEHRVALTGTPVENRLSELWSVMDVLNPGLLGTADRFRERYAVPIERHGSDEAASRLRTVTRPYLLRRVKTDPTDHRRPAREDRDHAALPAHARAGHALPHGRRRHDGEDRGRAGHPARGATCSPRWPS